MPLAITKNYAFLATAIASYMNRDASTFVVNGVDLLQLAVNNAKDYCQRAVVLEYARASATVHNVDLVLGSSLTSAVRYGTDVPLMVRNVERVFLGFLDGSGQFPINFQTRQAYTRRLQRRFENLASADPTKNLIQATANRFPFTCTLVGQNFFIAPPDTTAFGGASVVDVFFDVIEWLPDFTYNEQTSFLLDFGFQFMLLRSMVELNFFLKEDSRVQISSAALSDSWNNFVQWNATIVGLNVDDANLD